MTTIEERLDNIGCNGLKMEIYKFLAPRCKFCNGGPETWMQEKFLPLNWDKKPKLHYRFECCSKVCYYGMKLRNKEVVINNILPRMITSELIKIATENKMINTGFIIPDFIFIEYKASKSLEDLIQLLKDIIPCDCLIVNSIRQRMEDNGYSDQEISEVLSTEFYDYYIRNCNNDCDQNFLSLVPEQFLTEELCKVAIERYPRNFTAVPEALWTQDLINLAVTKDGSNLELIPDHMHTYELITLAVTSKGEMIFYVNRTIIDEALFRLALSTYGDVIHMLETLDLDINLEDFCPGEQRLRSYKKAIELIALAVTQDGCALEHLTYMSGIIGLNIFTKDKDIDFDLALENGRRIVNLAVNQNGYALRYVHPRLLTPELVKLALSKNGRVMQFIPEKYLTPELIQLGLITSPEMIMFSEHETQFLNDAQGTGIANLFEVSDFYIEPTLVTHDIAKRVVEIDGKNLRYIPAYKITQELCDLAVKQNVVALKLVPGRYRTQELLISAVKADHNALHYLYHREITMQMVILALSKSESVLKCIPREFRAFIRYFLDFTPGDEDWFYMYGW